MSLMGAEAIADAAVAYLGEFAPAKLDEIAARGWVHSIDLDPPVVIRVDDPFRATEADFPVWFVMPEDAELPTSKGGDKVMGAHRFVFAALVHHPGALAPGHDGSDARTPSEMAGRLAMRHALAIYELLTEMSLTTDSDYYANGQRVKWGTAGSPIRMQFLRFDPSEKGDGLALAGVEAGATLSEVR